MNRGDIRKEVSWRLGFNESQTNQDFTVARLNLMIQTAYGNELSLAQVHGKRTYFKKRQSITWLTTETTKELPVQCSQKSLIRIIDETNGVPGYPLSISDDGKLTHLFWLDDKTLQWGTVGPPYDATVTFEFMPNAETLVSDSSTPLLIADGFHEVIVWSACTLGRDVSDEASPSKWEKNLDQWRHLFWKYTTEARPLFGYSSSDVNQEEY